MGFSGRQKTVATVRTERGTHTTHKRAILLAVDAQWIQVFLAVALGYLGQTLHKTCQLQISAERLRSRRCLAAGTGHCAISGRLACNAAQAGTAETMAALSGHWRIEQHQAQWAGQFLAQEAWCSRHGEQIWWENSGQKKIPRRTSQG